MWENFEAVLRVLGVCIPVMCVVKIIYESVGYDDAVTQICQGDFALLQCGSFLQSWRVQRVDASLRKKRDFAVKARNVERLCNILLFTHLCDALGIGAPLKQCTCSGTRDTLVGIIRNLVDEDRMPGQTAQQLLQCSVPYGPLQESDLSAIAISADLLDDASLEALMGHSITIQSEQVQARICQVLINAAQLTRVAKHFHAEWARGGLDQQLHDFLDKHANNFRADVADIVLIYEKLGDQSHLECLMHRWDTEKKYNFALLAAKAVLRLIATEREKKKTSASVATSH